MTDPKKRRLSMLDSLASAGAVSGGPPTMMSTNRALRSARDAVDSHHVWELDPWSVRDERVRDRLSPDDIDDLRDAIEQNGQTVPILVRRDPSDPDKYLLVYGARRLAAIRASDTVQKVRALVTSLDDHAAMQSQISENMARRDLSYIEKALFAQELVDSGFGNQSQVAEVLTVTKSSISMAMAIANSVGRDLIEQIGAAHGIGRPRWEALSRMIDTHQLDRDKLAHVAQRTHVEIEKRRFVREPVPDNASVAAFEAVEKAVAEMVKMTTETPARRSTAEPRQTLTLDGQRAGAARRTSKGLALDLTDTDFADWLAKEAQSVIEELHARYKTRAED